LFSLESMVKLKKSKQKGIINLKSYKKNFLLFSVMFFSTTAFSQSGYYISINFQKAYANNTRSYDGKPGEDYWQNKADYDIKVNFDPFSRKLTGNENIDYYNNSPDTLKKLVFHLFPDIYKKGNRRDFNIDAEDESGGVTITKLILNGKEINYDANNKNLFYNHTSFTIYLDDFVLPGAKINLNVEWNYVENKDSHIRSGEVDSTSFFIAYFFPRLAVYDDINGWNNFNYTGDAEFYNDFGNFKLAVTVPNNFIVWATGTLQNPEEVFTQKYLTLYNKALNSDNVIHIIDSTDYLSKDITQQNSFNTFRFSADKISDVAFALSNHYLWDASNLLIDKKTGRKTLISAAYNKSSEDFYEVQEIAKKVIGHMSYNFPGVPFPFPSMTVFNGLSEMEYPMMVNDTTRDLKETYKLTTHEIFHSYFPFYMGINETNYAWMDEGITSFITYCILKNIYPEVESNQPFGDDYKNLIGIFGDEPLFVNSNIIKRPNYDYVCYDKPLSFFLVLQDFLGEEVFKNTLQEFMNRWKEKRPMPYDFFYTFENVTGKNLEWLINPWFFQYGYVDLVIKDVIKKKWYEINIENKGLLPAHFGLVINYSDDSCDTLEYKASVWMKKENIFKISLPSNKKIINLEILDKTLIDANLKNNKMILNQIN